ncbi:MAG: cellulase family glycosylhydrolase [Clostridia bacterium]|nr:cellulase family glycosylhydrolase [Clostridia bacterium]
MMKRLLSLFLCLLMALSAVTFAIAEDAAAPAMPFRDVDAASIVREMGLGWNLGNTFDAHTAFTPDEVLWQPVYTTPGLITAVHDAGFSTVRVPVTWGTMIDDANGYAINEAWLSRVQDVVDYAMRHDMYVIVNIHHDGAEQTGWLRVAAEGEKFEAVKEKFAAVWEQIAIRFRDYDEHLIFECMNEVTGDDNSVSGINRDFRHIEELNQLFVDTVRATGGNNARRWLMVVPRYTNIVNVLKDEYGFTMPVDPCEPARLMLSVHDYDWVFGLQDNMNATIWNQDKALALMKHFLGLKEKFTDKGIPVVLGEYGAAHKNNDGARAYYYEAMTRMSVMCGVAPICWSAGTYNLNAKPADYSMCFFDRKTYEQPFPGVVSAMMRGYYHPIEGDLRMNILRGLTQYEDKAVAPVLPSYTSVTTKQKQVFLESGKTAQLAITAEPADAKDVLVYSSSNPEVVTVNQGLLQGKAPGSSKVTVKSQSGDAKVEVIVIVRNTKTANPVTAINVPASVTLKAGTSLDLGVTVAPADTDDAVYFTSSDNRVVMVNGLGKLVGIAEGKAKVTVITGTGKKATVDVKVEAKDAAPKGGVNVAVGAYYNDQVNNYYGNDVSDVVTLMGDGTYTITFDCSKHLSQAAKDAGVSSLKGLGALYLYDISSKSGVLSSCDIHWDEIVIDGVAMTVKEHAPKSALKANGKLDTNDPLNAWDGSYIEEVVENKETFNVEFQGGLEPQVVTITFTISNWAYAE